MGHTVVVVGLIYLLHVTSNLEIPKKKKKKKKFEWSQCCLTPNCQWESRHSGSDGQRHDATSPKNLNGYRSTVKLLLYTVLITLEKFKGSNLSAIFLCI